jgi:pyruvate dehydrogenase E1 component
VWSVTSYVQLYRDGHAADRWNMLHPAGPARLPFVTEQLKDAPGVFVAASDYVKALPDSIDRWLPRPLEVLGTDGFGRSEGRTSLRDFFEVDHRYIVIATLGSLAREGKLASSVVREAIQALAIDPEKLNPWTS